MFDLAIQGCSVKTVIGESYWFLSITLKLTTIWLEPHFLVQRLCDFFGF